MIQMTYRRKIEADNFEKMEIAKQSVPAHYTERIPAEPHLSLHHQTAK